MSPLCSKQKICALHVDFQVYVSTLSLVELWLNYEIVKIKIMK